ncbi:DUF3592 domain-containing protein [Microbispora rosea]|uniref:DUF3592 domain-containing protein n=1 Tax=Microbispora rosea TaxID=58117 RepID=A0A1N7AFL0_9ACTN|nr:DUF3592 domain-containing protein [Microbispora rosea]GIH48098.1 hypothetical protein Mro03_32770 [Microbispora rosea subsp. rosea]SIR37773.1 hypothetical protein SAMN05421833_108163 [Microbispora rosea]
MARWSSRRSLSGVGSFAFFAAWFGILIVMLVAQVFDIVSALDLGRHGVRTTGVALSTRSETWNDTDGHPITVNYTKIGFTVGTQRHVEEISGWYATGEKVRIVYDPESVNVVRSEEDTGLGGLAGNFVGIAILLAMLVFGVSFVFSWHRW